jgi:hypothetical protein
LKDERTFMSLSYTPMISAIVPPLMPGKRSAMPIIIPRKKLRRISLHFTDTELPAGGYI